MSPATPLRIGLLHPSLTQPLGDEGNAEVLAARAAWRGIPVTTVVVDGSGDSAADIYLLGGMPNRDQAKLVDVLATDDVFGSAVAAGAPVLGVNAGYEVLARSFEASDGSTIAGLGLLEVTLTRGMPVEGPVITKPGGPLGLPEMSGFESHEGRARLGPGAEALAPLELGVGNGEGSDDGALGGRVIGTFIHGPVLARNPELADALLSWALGEDLAELPAGAAERLRAYRIAEDRVDPTGWGGRKYGTAITLRTRLRGALGLK